MTKTIGSNEGVKELVDEILNSRRTRPVCVISTPNGELEPAFDPLFVDQEVSKFCDVFVIIGGTATREMQELMPPDTHVYGGAARAYPIDFAISKKPGTLRYVYPRNQLQRSTDKLTSDIWGFAMQAGLIGIPTSNTVDCDVLIKQIFEDSVAIGDSPIFGLISIRQEVICPGVPLSWVFEVGETIRGQIDRDTRIFNLGSQALTKDEVAKHFGFDTVTLGLVRETDRKTAIISVFPNVDFEVSKEEITGNPLDVINQYLRVGEVWPVRIYRDPQGRTRIKMNDIDDDEPIAGPLPILAGGKPWLDQARYAELHTEVEVEEPSPSIEAEPMVLEDFTPEPNTQTGTIATPLNMGEPIPKTKQDRLHEQAIAHYRAQIIKANREIGRLNDENKMLAGLLRETNEKLAASQNDAKDYRKKVAEFRKSKSETAPAESSYYELRNYFDSLEDWFREVVRRTWIELFNSSERSQYPLQDENWSFGENFFDSLNPREFDASELSKLARTVVFLVTGRNNVEHSYTFHPLRESGRPLMRGGDKGLRMHIENGQPQAKRLHYFKLAEGGYELSKAGLHDDFDQE